MKGDRLHLLGEFRGCDFINMVKEGKSIIVVSSELLEVLKLSDRVLVVRDGRIVAELTKEEAGQEVIMQYAMGGSSYE